MGIQMKRKARANTFIEKPFGLLVYIKIFQHFKGLEKNQLGDVYFAYT